MTQDERGELLKDLSAICYTHIRFSGLYRELTEDGWEQLAREHGEKVIELLESLVNERFTQIESKSQVLWYHMLPRHWDCPGHDNDYDSSVCEGAKHVG